jgi:hypothetical protein
MSQNHRSSGIKIYRASYSDLEWIFSAERSEEWKIRWNHCVIEEEGAEDDADDGDGKRRTSTARSTDVDTVVDDDEEEEGASV